MNNIEKEVQTCPCAKERYSYDYERAYDKTNTKLQKPAREKNDVIMP